MSDIPEDVMKRALDDVLDRLVANALSGVRLLKKDEAFLTQFVDGELVTRVVNLRGEDTASEA